MSFAPPFVRRRDATSLLLTLLVVALLASPVAAGAAPVERPSGTDGHPSLETARPDRPTATQSSNRSINVTTVSVVDRQTLPAAANSTFVWEAAPYNFTVTMETRGFGEQHYVDICTRSVGVSGTNATTNASCTVFTPNSNGTSTARVQDATLPAGEQTVVVTLHDIEANETLDSHDVPLTVVNRSGDFDSDRLNNEREVSLGTYLDVADTDQDGLDDGPEVGNYGTDPLSNDTDGDGLPDGEEVNSGTNATNPDTDGDGLDDGREVNELSTSPTDPDTDGDGLDDAAEVGVYESDPTNPDSDDDGLDDGTEVDEYGTSPVRTDTDGDGLSDSTEVRLGTSPTSAWTVVWLLLVLLVGVVAAVVGLLRWLGVPEVLTFRMREEAASAADEDDDAADASTTGDWRDEGRPPVQTDEGRVVELLEESGGRIYQRELVDRTDWSASKVSRLLSTMEEEDRIEKVRIGRENVVTLPGEEPTSPADDGNPG